MLMFEAGDDPARHHVLDPHTEKAVEAQLARTARAGPRGRRDGAERRRTTRNAPTSTILTAAVCLSIAANAIWIAALTPQFLPICQRQGDALEIIAQHTTLWRVDATLFLLSAVGTLIGCALVFATRRGPFGPQGWRCSASRRPCGRSPSWRA